MKSKLIVTAALIITLPLFANAQLKGLMNKIKNKVDQRVDNKVNKQIDKTLDEMEGKDSHDVANNGNTSTNTTDTKREEPLLKSYSKYDFVPGDTVLYSEDFTQEAIGELPVQWNSSGKGEVVTIDNETGTWLKMFSNTTYLTANKKSFTKNFTVEFDLILQLQNRGSAYPVFSFGIFSSDTLSSTDNDFLNNYNKYQSALFNVRLSINNATYTYLQTYLNSNRYFFSDQQNLGSLENYYNAVSHIAVQVQEKRFRVWINGEKKYDVPMALATDYIFNQLFFKVSPYNDPQFGFYISNLKVATGLPDTRHKLIETGKFSTTGILFDINSDKIKPTSYGTVKEIADVLQKYPDTKIKIIGHTDNDGSDASNLDLSKKRSAAVKTMLVNEFTIDASRIETDGKGEAEPVVDNKSKEGKAANRRVEFIKI